MVSMARRLCTLIVVIAAMAGHSVIANGEESSELLKRFRTEFVHVTPGDGAFPRKFRMGGEGNLGRDVVMKSEFWVGKYEVTQNLWEAVMGNNPSRWKGPRNSVELLDFADAQLFCQKVTAQLREAKLIESDQVVRLPSEAEWEYVARAGTSSIYSFGDSVEDLDDYAWHTGNAAGNDPPVGAKKPNPWGLYDVHGYLWEWCLDTWHADFQDAPTDSSPWIEAGSKKRVLRGGSWKDRAEFLRSDSRRSAVDTLKDDAVGLRCVLSSQ